MNACAIRCASAYTSGISSSSATRSPARTFCSSTRICDDIELTPRGMDLDARALFDALADQSPAEREDYYVRYEIPAALRAEVESLLLFDGESGQSLNACVAAAGDALWLNHAGDAALSGERYGSYRLLRLLGCGGMGAVYEAEQDNPRRIVARKVIRAGLTSPELLRRFQLESQTRG